MGTKTGISWTDATWLHVQPIQHHRIKEGLASSIQPVVKVLIAFGRVAGHAGRDHIIGLSDPATADRHDVIPRGSERTTVSAQSLEHLKNGFLANCRNRGHITLPRMSMLASLSTVSVVSGVAFPLVFSPMGAAHTGMDLTHRQPNGTPPTPRLPNQAAGDTFPLRRSLPSRRLIAEYTDSFPTVPATLVGREVGQCVPGLAAPTSLFPGSDMGSIRLNRDPQPICRCQLCALFRLQFPAHSRYFSPVNYTRNGEQHGS